MNRKTFSLVAVLSLFCCAVLWSSSAAAFGVCGFMRDPTPEEIREAILQSNIALSSPTGEGNHWEDKACTHFRRGYLYQQMGENDAALEDYNGALTIMPDFPEALAARADLYADMNQPDKAKKDYSAAELLAQNPKTLHEICLERLQRGRPLDRALAACNAAVALDPEDMNDLQDRGVANFRLGNYAAAILDFNASFGAGGPPATRDDDKLTSYAFSIYARGVAEIKMGNATAGNADIAEAQRAHAEIADLAKSYDIAP